MILSLHISQTDLSAKGLEKLTVHDIASTAQLPISEDIAHPTLEGVTIEQRTKLAKMAEEITKVLNSTGTILKCGGFQSLGTFVIDCAKKSKGEKGISASRFVHRVIICFLKGI